MVGLTGQAVCELASGGRRRSTTHGVPSLPGARVCRAQVDLSRPARSISTPDQKVTMPSIRSRSPWLVSRFTQVTP